MLSSSSSEFSQKFLKIKQDDKFYSRLLSKECSVANPSFRVYYGNVSGAVPFTWEVQPGTPKHNFCDNSVRPLTPPPSYYISNHHGHIKNPTKRRSRLLYNLLLNIHLIKKRHVASSSPSSLSSSSWSSSTSSSTVPSSRSRRGRFMSCGSSFDDGSRLDDGHMYGGGSPDSVMCFGMNNDKSNRDSNGAYTVVIMKKAFLSIVGRRSG